MAFQRIGQQVGYGLRDDQHSICLYNSADGLEVEVVTVNIRDQDEVGWFYPRIVGGAAGWIGINGDVWRRKHQTGVYDRLYGEISGGSSDDIRCGARRCLSPKRK